MYNSQSCKLKTSGGHCSSCINNNAPTMTDNHSSSRQTNLTASKYVLHRHCQTSGGNIASLLSSQSNHCLEAHSNIINASNSWEIKKRAVWRYTAYHKNHVCCIYCGLLQVSLSHIFQGYFIQTLAIWSILIERHCLTNIETPII